MCRTGLLIRIAILELCALSSAASSWTTCEQYGALPINRQIFNNNIWNPSNPGDGEQCIYVNSDRTAFNVTWIWNKAPDYMPVRSFPNVQFQPAELPIKLADLGGLTINGTWDIRPADPATTSLDEIGARTNAALDLWIDEIPSNSTNPKWCKQEMMIWLGEYGTAAPFGKQSIVHKAGDQDFQLWIGEKEDGREVLSFAHNGPAVKTFDLDVLGFFDSLTAQNLTSPDAYLGIVQFGSEAFNSNADVLFSASNFDMILTARSTRSTSAPTTSSTTTPRPSVATAPLSAQFLYSSWSMVLLLGVLSWHLLW